MTADDKMQPLRYYEIPSFSDVPSTRPSGFAEHVPYYCHEMKQLRLDRMPVTVAEVRQCCIALRDMLAITRQKP